MFTRRANLITIWTLAVFCSLGSLGQAPPAAPTAGEVQDKEDALNAWVIDNYTEALVALYKGSCDVPKSSGSMRWTVCTRITPGEPGDPEFSVLVGKGYDGRRFARITRSKGQSVYVQLGDQKRMHPTATVGDLIKSIQLESVQGGDKEFPTLKRIVEEFEQIRFSPVLPEILFSDPTEFDISLASVGAERTEMVLYGPGLSDVGQPHPLLSWVARTRQILEASFK